MERRIYTETPYWEKKAEEESREDDHSPEFSSEKSKDFTFDDWASI